MRRVLAFLFLSLAAPLGAEGIASMTEITRENAKKLDYHGLAVIRKSQLGKSYIALIIRPRREHPFGTCGVTIYDKTGKQILFQVDPRVGPAPDLKGFPDGSRIYFHVADELVDDIEVRYHLSANQHQSHVFTIPRGQLGKVANL
ncbi:MAG: hypothetical protein HKN82_11405 [Akkermansiaceae bacterium]|nr:hypothetical protein [Akkermansiaceae bacterium]